MDRERITSFEQMKVWQEAHYLVLRTFEVTPSLPPEQQEGIALAMERAAIEVPKTIAEGFKRRGSRNKAHYYNLAQSHLEALRYYFILCRDLKYTIDYEDMAQRTDTVSRMLDSLVRSMARQNAEGPRRGRRGRGGRNDNRGFRNNDSDPDSFDGPPDSDLSDDDLDDADIGTGD
jgi:four helix bundle protein